MKTKEQVLAITSLTAEQRERAIAYFLVQERFNKPRELNVDSEAQVKDFLDGLIKKYKIRKEAEAKRKEKKEKRKEEINKLVELVDDAKNYGLTIEDVISIVKGKIKETKNAEIQAKIDELKAQMIQ